MEKSMPGALKAALDFEEKGREFYTKTAQKVSDPLSQTLFTTLAADEVKHADRIRAIFAALQSGQAWPAAAGAGHRRLEDEIKKYFQAHRQTLKTGVSNLEGYEFAMGMERAGIDLYRRSAAAAAGAEKQFFEALIQEEMGHLEAIRNVHYYLTQPGDWLENDESRHWNWMNL